MEGFSLGFGTLWIPTLLGLERLLLHGDCGGTAHDTDATEPLGKAR